MIKQLQQIANFSQKQLFVCFVDLSAAFDHINRKLLFKTLKNWLPQYHSSTTIGIMENLYDKTQFYMYGAKPSEAFPTSSGVRQGGVERPPLYNYYNDYSLRVYDNRKCDAGVTGLQISYHIPEEATDRLQKIRSPATGTSNDDESGYADDLGVFSWSAAELQICMNILAAVFEEFGLVINLDKTKTMIINPCGISYPESIIIINSVDIENVTLFKYVVVCVSHDQIHIGCDEIDNRINSAHNSFSEHRKILTNTHIYSLAN